MKRKNPWIAGSLGLILGPLGTLYFGIRTCFFTLINVFLCALITTLIMGLPFHDWGKYIYMLFWAFMCALMCGLYNEKTAENNDKLEYDLLIFWAMNGWIIRVQILIGCLGATVELFMGGHPFRGLLMLVLFAPLTIYISEMIITGIIHLLILGFSAIAGKITRKRNA